VRPVCGSGFDSASPSALHRKNWSPVAQRMLAFDDDPILLEAVAPGFVAHEVS